MTLLLKTLLGIHIAAGVVALVSGFGAALVAKRRGWHTNLGKAYVVSMFTVAATAVPITYLRPNAFLFLVALFSFQLTYSGWRTAGLMNRPGTAVDRAFAVLAQLWSLAFIGYGIFRIVGGDNFGAVAIVFGLIGVNGGRIDLRRFTRGGNSDGPWILAHIQMMGGALIATTTAVLVVNSDRLLPGVPSIAIWLFPAVVGSPLIGYAVRSRSPKKRPTP